MRDFFDDVLGKNSYSFQIIKFFNEGIANFIGSPSYKSIENIRGVVSAVITRVERNPNVLISTEVTSKKPQHGSQDPELPKLVTLNWLWQHVPVKFWYILFGIIFGAFLLGIQASRLAIVREMFGY